MESMTRRRTVLSCWLGAVLIAALPALAVAADALETINVAGEQRMLSQRIVKAYVQLGLNLQPLAAKSQLDASMRRFESNQQVLAKAVAVNPDARQALTMLEQAWAAMRPLAVGVPNPDAARRLSQYAETVLNAAEMLVNVFADASGADQHRVLRLAARQRMLSQRIAKAYMLQSWGDRSASVRHELEDAVATFDGVLAQFVARRGDPPEIRQELDDLALQWEWLKAALESEGALSYRLIVSEATDGILAGADRLTQHYQIHLAKR